MMYLYIDNTFKEIMDGQIRDLGFVAWRDSLASYEKMKGSEWESALKEESYIWKKAYNRLDKKQIDVAKQILTIAQEETRPAIFKAGPYITVAPAGSFSVSWSWQQQQSQSTVSRDIQLHPTDSEIVYIVGDAGGGSESYELVAQHRTRGQLWRRSPVGPTIGIIGHRIYYLGVENSLRYLRVYSCNLEDGQDERLIYEETDKRCNLFLQRVANGLYIIADNSGKQRIGYIGDRGGIHWLSARFYKESIIPVGPHGNYIFTENEKYVSQAGWKLPYDGDMDRYGIEWGSAAISGKKGWLVAREYGAKTLYWCSSTAPPVKKYILTTGTILYDGFYSSEQNGQIIICILSPTKSIHTISLSPNADSFIITRLPTPSLQLFKGLKETELRAKSADGTLVYGRMISTTSKPVALLIIGYGAYGLPTSIGTCKSQWGPLLANGWAVAYAFIRGGGDHNDHWTNEGRHLMRERSIEDFEAIITSAQKLTHCNGHNTVIYGRSAGGLLVGATLNRAIAMIAGVFSEVPYVDVLRTSSNPTLPLTEMEYEEFGNPHTFVDFMLLSSISPIDNIVANGTAADKFVLCRSGLRDKEVLPYEPVKWIHTLRKMNPAGKGPKVLAMETEEGHFYSLNRGIETRAIDLVMLQHFLSSLFPLQTFHKKSQDSI